MATADINFSLGFKYTWPSPALHLHYEIFVNGIRVNPIHYFFNDLNPKEYEKIIELASAENQSLGM